MLSRSAASPRPPLGVEPISLSVIARSSSAVTAAEGSLSLGGEKPVVASATSARHKIAITRLSLVFMLDFLSRVGIWSRR
jgi:hypothetical protein